jgi:hypothetical protein
MTVGTMADWMAVWMVEQRVATMAEMKAALMVVAKAEMMADLWDLK